MGTSENFRKAWSIQVIHIRCWLPAIFCALFIASCAAISGDNSFGTTPWISASDATGPVSISLTHNPLNLCSTSLYLFRSRLLSFAADGEERRAEYTFSSSNKEREKKRIFLIHQIMLTTIDDLLLIRCFSSATAANLISLSLSPRSG